MTVNLDPKPGRWILPLVILAMIAFTFFFVRALPEATPDTTLAVEAETTTTVGDPTETTLPAPAGATPVDAVTQAYLDELDAINADLQVLGTEMVTVNAGFDADPREILYGEIEGRLETLATASSALADRVAALTIPAGLEASHSALQSAIDFGAGSAQDALDGVRSADTGELRQAAVEVYTNSVSDFATEVQNTKTAAGSG